MTGNATSIAGETHTYDATDRHLTTVKGTTTVTYRRDPLDRIIARTETTSAATTTTRYGFTAGGDSPDLTLTPSNTLIERTLGLPGGATVTTRAGGDVWSYPNLHGDTAATATAAGTKNGTTVTYDPFGNVTSGQLPDNSDGNYDYGWHGQAQRGLEHATGLAPITEMGARQYSATLGRFIEQDPVEGGVDNDYTYVNDPINNSDLDGRATDCGGGRSASICDAVPLRNRQRYGRELRRWGRRPLSSPHPGRSPAWTRNMTRQAARYFTSGSPESARPTRPGPKPQPRPSLEPAQDTAFGLVAATANGAGYAGMGLSCLGAVSEGALLGSYLAPGLGTAAGVAGGFAWCGFAAFMFGES